MRHFGIDILSDFYAAVGLHHRMVYVYRCADVSVSAGQSGAAKGR